MDIPKDQILPQVKLPQADDMHKFFTPKPAKSEEQFWDNQALLPGYQGVVVDTENNLSTQMLYNFMATQLNFENEVIVDIGCGVGRLFPVYVNFQAKEIHGIDLSMNMVRVARFKYPQDNIYLYKLSADNMEAIEDSKATLVVSVSVLCHIVDDDKMVKAANEMIRICANGGVIFICEPMSVTANIHHEHSMMRTRPIATYQKIFGGGPQTSSKPYPQEIYSGRECFGPVDHIDSIRTVLIYRKKYA